MPKVLTIGVKALASISEVGLMRKMYGLPEVVILPEDEVSTSIGTSYSMSFGITASVSVELHAPIITGTLSLRDQLLGGGHRLGRVGLVVLDHELDLAAQHAALRVDRVLGDLRALRHVVARRGEGAGQRLRHADADRLLRGRGARNQRGGERRSNTIPNQFHRFSPSDA